MRRVQYSNYNWQPWLEDTDWKITLPWCRKFLWKKTTTQLFICVFFVRQSLKCHVNLKGNPRLLISQTQAALNGNVISNKNVTYFWKMESSSFLICESSTATIARAFARLHWLDTSIYNCRVLITVISHIFPSNSSATAEKIKRS